MPTALAVTLVAGYAMALVALYLFRGSDGRNTIDQYWGDGSVTDDWMLDLMEGKAQPPWRRPHGPLRKPTPESPGGHWFPDFRVRS
jgi:hypothetical protein